MRNTTKMKRDIMKGSTIVGQAGHSATVVARRKLRVADNRLRKFGAAERGTVVVARRNVRVFNNRVGKTGHVTGIIARRKIKVAGRRIKKIVD